MKRAFFLIIGLVLIAGTRFSGVAAAAYVSQGDSVTIVATPDVSALAVVWAEEYNKTVAGAKVKIQGVPDPARAGELVKGGALGLVRGDEKRELPDEQVWSLVLGKDILVPVINASNPYSEQISSQGITAAKLAQLAKGGERVTWGALLGNGSSEQVKFFCPAGEEALNGLGSFMQADAAIFGTFSRDDDALLGAVRSDRFAIAFCKLVTIMDQEKGRLTENISLLPIDRNSNGILDNNEKIYDDLNGFKRGVWIGKYPRSLVSNICSVSLTQPVNPEGMAFLKWVVSEGQRFLPGYGYTELLASEKTSAAERINTSQVMAGASTGSGNLLRPLLILITTIILAGLLVTTAARKRKKVKEFSGARAEARNGIIDQSAVLVPGGLYFDKTHTWAFMEENGTVRVGIDDFLQHVTGRITRIRMKGTGRKVMKGESVLSVMQNGKQLNLYSPVSGTIVEQNAILEDNPTALNTSPYRDGWIYRIEPSNWARESQLLFMADRQKEFIKKEFARLKDFLMNIFKADPEYAQLILQDGGEIAEGVLSEMGPETWEDFQTSFIDPSRQVWFYELFHD